MIRARTDTILGLALLLLLAGCQGQRMGISTAAGGIGGATAGGLLGAALGGGNTGIAGGVLLGGLLGAGVGQMMDQRSQQLQAQTVTRALETAPVGTASTWTNPDNGTRGSITSDPNLPKPERRLLPGVPAGDRRRRPDPAGDEHRVPAAGRLVADPELRGDDDDALDPHKPGDCSDPQRGPRAGPGAAAGAPEPVRPDGRNKDGRITPEEYRARMVEVFFLLDRNKDGALVRDEIPGASEDGLPRRRPER